MAGSTYPPPGERRDSHVGAMLADRYRVDALVDRGAMGRVYVGEHVLMKKRVAIKVLHRELTTVPEFVARFEREAMAAANIDDEHVVAATDFGKLADGAVFLVLEFVEGKNLRDEIGLGPMPVPRALHIARQIATALRSAHALGIVHRDLKPENVMLVERAGDPDFVKVLDFGIAKVPLGEPVREEAPTSKPITKAGMVFGTPEYMAPEQALGQNVDHRADLYSLGIILYEMLAGCRPFAASSQVGVLGQQLSTPVPPFSQRAPQVVVPPAVERFVTRLLAREPSGRFPTAQAVVEEIEQHLGYSTGRERIPTLLDGTQVRNLSSPPASPSDDDALPTQARSIPGLSSPFDRVSGWIDSKRSALPEPLRKLPAPVLLSAPLAIVGIVLGFGVVSALSPARRETTTPPASAPAPALPSSAPAEAPGKAPAVDLSRATEAGRDALAALAAKYPTDPAVPLALSGVELKQKELGRAVDAIAEALKLDPSLANDSQIASALWITAQNKRSSAAAFEILKGPMGDRGLSILRDLAGTPGVREAIREQAKQALASKQKN